MSRSIVAPLSPDQAHNRNCPQAQSTPPCNRRDGPNSKRSNVKQAVRRFSEAPAPTAPSATATSATVVRLSAVAGGGTIDHLGTAAAAPPTSSTRRGSRGGDLILGGILALILLVACLAWEMLSDRDEPSQAALQGESSHLPVAR
jgi:hypothetical protein